MPMTAAVCVMADEVSAIARAMPKSMTLTWPDGRQHDVGRLDVAVDDAGAVAVVERAQHVGRDRQRTLGQDLATVLGAAQDVAQRLALDVLHDDVGHVAAVLVDRLAGVVDRDDRGVVERCGRLGLAAEAGLERVVGGEVAAKLLDGDGAAEAQVAADAYVGHAAASEQAAELIALAQADGLVAGFGHDVSLPDIVGRCSLA